MSEPKVSGQAICNKCGKQRPAEFISAAKGWLCFECMKASIEVVDDRRQNGDRRHGLRDNKGKLPWHLLPVEAMEEIVKVLQFGATKYAPENWRKGLSWDETYDSLMRHLIAWKRGEKVDPETGLPHMAHVLTNAAFLMSFELTNTGTDDRWKQPTTEKPNV